MKKTTEVEDQKLNELKLLASIAKYANNSIVLLNAQGHIIWANKGFTSMYGYSVDEYNEHITENNSEFIRILNDLDTSFFKTNTSLNIARTIFTKENIKKWVQSTITQMPDNNDTNTQYIVIEADITQQKEVEEELVQKWENTQTLTEHLESVKDYIEEQIKELAEQKRVLQVAKEKSEEVLNKVLPYEVAIQLKKKGYAAPRHYKKVTILHLNFRNFIELSELIPIEDLVTQLHECLTQIDVVLEKHYVEKIKTSGGIYIGAGGVPLRNRSNPIDVALAALKIGDILNKTNKIRKEKNLPVFKSSIGIHTGKVIAGVVGKNKLSYDIWGDAVNLASTIENNTPDETIQISESTFEEIKEYFDCTLSEKIILGTAEDINIYKLKRITAKYSEDEIGHSPNSDFMSILSKL